MQNKNTVLVFSVLFLVVGFIIGRIGTTSKGVISSSHLMPDGSIMGNSDTMDMSGMMQDMMANLEGKTGDDFDKAFIDEMIVHHEGAVDMAEAALTSAKHQEIKDMANAIISAQTTEIKQMQDWKKAWYK